eukprot:1701817-Amphidinium_carterae.1
MILSPALGGWFICVGAIFAKRASLHQRHLVCKGRSPTSCTRLLSTQSCEALCVGCPFVKGAPMVLLKGGLLIA